MGHQNQIDSLSSQVEAFEESGHFDSASIQERQLELVARYDGLQVTKQLQLVIVHVFFVFTAVHT